MGSDDFHKKFVRRDEHERKDGKRQHNLESIGDDAVFGVDVSTMLHECLRTKNGSEVFDMKPMVPLYYALSSFKKNLSTLLKRGTDKIILFFDGESHPMKYLT